MEPTFNLVDQPWIPLRRRRGDTQVTSLREAILRAHEFEHVEDGSPLVTGALHRLLLAVVHRALQGPASVSEGGALLAAGRFPADRVSSYLDTWRERFDLFARDRPFYQLSWFELPPPKRSPAARLAPELASGNNKLLFDHSFEADARAVPPGLVARWLIGCQTSALGGGKSSFNYLSHAPVATSALVLPIGQTLFETLCLNLIPYPAEEQAADQPCWEAEEPTEEAIAKSPLRSPRGLCDQYTWWSRALRLHCTEGGPFAVESVSYASGITPSGEGDSTGWTDDPMVAYRVDPKVGVRPLSIRPERAFWRDFSSLVPASGSSSARPPRTVQNAYAVLRRAGRGDETVRVAVFGQASDKAKIQLWRAEWYPLPRSLFGDRKEVLRDALQRGLEKAEEVGGIVRKAGWGLASEMLSGGSSRKPDKKAVSKMLESFPLARVFWSRQETQFPSFLARLDGADGDGDSALLWWLAGLRETALAAFQATLSALGERASVLRAASRAERFLVARLSQVVPVNDSKEVA